MQKIKENIYIGDQYDFESNTFDDSWFIILACKEPYHREALGYSTKSAPINNPEYYMAFRENKLILNLIDSTNIEYIPKLIIDGAINLMKKHSDKKILVHCNKGESRSATIVLLYLKNILAISNNYDEAIKLFKVIYPKYNPGKGMKDFTRVFWNLY